MDKIGIIKEETKKRIISEKNVPSFIKKKIKQQEKEQNDSGCLGCIGIILIGIIIIGTVIYGIVYAITSLGIAKVIFIVVIIIFIILGFKDPKVGCCVFICIIMVIIGGIASLFDNTFKDTPSDNNSSTVIEESIDKDNSNQTSESSTNNSNAITEEKDKEEYTYATFTDSKEGFSFIYPLNLGEINQNESSRYAMSFKDMDIQVVYESLLGGRDKLNENFRIEKSDKGEIVSSKLYDNTYEFTAVSDRNVVYVCKYYCGNTTHQGMRIQYPKKYLNDEKYQEVVSKLLEGFKPANPIP